MLKDLYEELESIDLRAYSGLDDKTLSLLEEVKVPAMGEASLSYQTIPIIFLPPELERARECFKTARKLVSQDEVWLARFEDYDAFLDGLAAASSAYAVTNVATALGVILGVFEHHQEDLSEGWYGEEEPKHKKWVPVASVLGTYDIPAPRADSPQGGSQDRDRGEVSANALWQALEFWAAIILAGGRAWADQRHRRQASGLALENEVVKLRIAGAGYELIARNRAAQSVEHTRPVCGPSSGVSRRYPKVPRRFSIWSCSV